MKYVILLLLCVTQVQGAGKRSQDGAKDLYCARENCYDVLGVENTATKSEIKRAFRQISIKHHPDKTKDPKSPDIFSAAANAYEILSSVESRENYDYYQAHPEESLNNMFGYYAQAAKKISVVPVFFLLLIIISIFKHLANQHQYDAAVSGWKGQDKVQLRAKKEAVKVLGKQGKISKKQWKINIKIQMEKWMDNQIETGCVAEFPTKPTWKDMFIIHFLKFPYTMYEQGVWYRGFRRRLNSKTLTKEDEEYLTYSTLGKTEQWWKKLVVLEREESKALLKRKLWEGDNLKIYKAQDKTEGVDMTGLNAGMKKQYKRYLKAKKNGTLRG